jgi:pSer/pThr/pTyr-binding forkhead associated (FHA) protein
MAAPLPANVAQGVSGGTPAAVPAVASPARAVSAPMAAAAAVSLKPAAVTTPIMPTKAPEPPEPERPVFGRLVAVRRDGTDGDSIALAGESLDVGRIEGSMTFPEDPFLAPRHARFTFGAAGVKVRSLDAVNGVFLKVRGTADLLPGDLILVGKELLRYEALAPEERDPPSLVEHGVRIFGTVQREAWGRLRQLTMAGTTRDVWHLTRPELVLGREEGDVTFPDDEFLSRRHATVRKAAAGQRAARIEDMGSSNGTFLRVRGERELQPGDILRVGDQLLRLEA